MRAGWLQKKQLWIGEALATIKNTMDKTLQPMVGGRSDGFVARLRATDAELQASTYLGGAGKDRISAVALDAIGNISVTGKTEPVDAPQPGDRIIQQRATSGDFPVLNAFILSGQPLQAARS